MAKKAAAGSEKKPLKWSELAKKVKPENHHIASLFHETEIPREVLRRILEGGSAVLLCNFRIVVCEAMTVVLLSKTRAGAESSSNDLLKEYGLAMLTLSLGLLLPIFGMNSALDILISRAYGCMVSRQ